MGERMWQLGFSDKKKCDILPLKYSSPFEWLPKYSICEKSWSEFGAESATTSLGKLKKMMRREHLKMVGKIMARYNVIFFSNRKLNQSLFQSFFHYRNPFLILFQSIFSLKKLLNRFCFFFNRFYITLKCWTVCVAASYVWKYIFIFVQNFFCSIHKIQFTLTLCIVFTPTLFIILKCSFFLEFWNVAASVVLWRAFSFLFITVLVSNVNFWNEKRRELLYKMFFFYFQK